MKFLLYADNHYSKQSSILRSRGVKYSTRLENQIASINWVESTATQHGCDAIICLGDFFDRPQLDAEELSALRDIDWSPENNRLFLVGNHELGISVHDYNSTNLFSLMGGVVYDKPFCFAVGSTCVCMLPYILEENRLSLKEYLVIPQGCTRVVVLSHNDICGISYGGYESKTGFSLAEISACCDLYINGHLHNGQWISEKILNLGNLTGQNFSEDGNLYKHNIAILDTDTLSVELIENPHAIGFYKMGDGILHESIPKNSVISVSCSDGNAKMIRELLDSCVNVLDYRITINRDEETRMIEDKSCVDALDYLKEFATFVVRQLGKTKELEEELAAILGYEH